MALHLKSTGIDFADISSGSVLDDYEEGSATLTAKFGGTGGSDNGTGDWVYTKIGNVVYGDVYISLNNSIQGTGHAVMTGLPFSVAEGVTGVPYTNDRVGAIEYCNARFTGTSIYWYKHPTSNSTNLANWDHDNWADGVGGKGIAASGFYFA